MIQTLLCNSCGASLHVKDMSAAFIVCEFCGSNNIITGFRDDVTILKSVTFINQVNPGKRFDVDLAGGKAFVGRMNAGSAILSEWNDISRTHCSLTVRNFALFVKDENSTNGTFYGPQRIPCKEETRVGNGGILFLSNQSFMLHFNGE